MRRFGVFLTAMLPAIVIVLGLHVSGNAAAQGRTPESAVKKHDKNGDGRVSRDEWTRSPNVFKRIDKNGDGFLTADDFAKFFAARRAKRGDSDQQPEKSREKQDGQKKQISPDEIITKLDRDGDGKIARAEWRRDDKNFKRRDADGDGFITREELTAGKSSTNGDQAKKSDTNGIKAKLLGIWKVAVEQRSFVKSAIVLAHRGKIVAQEAIRVGAATPMHVASVSKSFTGACAYEAMKQGVLSEDMKLGDIFGARLEGIGLDDAARANISIGALLSQTAGIGPDRTQNGAYSSYYGSAASQDKIIAQTALRAGPHKPGKYYYTKENFSIFAEALETRSGKSYELYCTEAVFRPIGVNSARLSDYWGFFASGGGWQISTLDLAKFAMHYANPRQGLGAELSRFASGTIKGKLKYGMGMAYRSKGEKIGAITHSGYLNDGKGRRDAGFFFSSRDGWVAALTATELMPKEMQKLQNDFMKMILGRS